LNTADFNPALVVFVVVEPSDALTSADLAAIELERDRHRLLEVSADVFQHFKDGADERALIGQQTRCLAHLFHDNVQLLLGSAARYLDDNFIAEAQLSRHADRDRDRAICGNDRSRSSPARTATRSYTRHSDRDVG